MKTRTEILIGKDGIKKLEDCHVAIFGVGGVGGYVAESLVRSGIGKFTLIDRDVVSVSNINRQIIATHDTVGRYKAEVMKERMLSINPGVQVIIRNEFFLPEKAANYEAPEVPYDLRDYDYVVDAVDTVSAKLEIIMRAKEAGTPVISAMGAGNKMDPSRFQVADIYETSICPLARVMRHECKKRGIKSLKVAFSTEEPKKSDLIDEETKKAVPGSMIFTPAACGLVIGAEVVKDLIK